MKCMYFLKYLCGRAIKPPVIPRPVLTLFVGIRIPFRPHLNLPPYKRERIATARLRCKFANWLRNDRLVWVGASFLH